MLIALRMTAPQDRSAVDEWIKGHGSDAERKRVTESLATMDIGEAWVWAPNHSAERTTGTDVPSVRAGDGDAGANELAPSGLTKTQIRLRHTFDASATPKVGESVRVPQALADVDMTALAERFAVQLDVAKENDPATLKTRIAELSKQLAERPKPERVEVPVERIVETVVEVPVIAASEVTRLGELRDSMVGTAKDLMNMAGEITARLTALANVKSASPSRPPKAVAAVPPEIAPTPTVPETAEETLVAPVSRPQQAILDALAEFAAVRHTVVSRSVIAVRSGASPRSSAFTNNLSALRTKGFVDYPNGSTATLTDAGAKTANSADKPLTLSDYRRGWYRLLSAPQARIIEYLVEQFPNKVSREAAAEGAGVSASSSSFKNNLSALSSLGLVSYPDGKSVVATSLLFPEGLS